MKSTIKYKGYTGRVEFDAEDNILFGEVIGLREIITFQGTTVEEIVNAFHKSVDSYLKFCEEHNQHPEKPFSGKIPFRTTPEIHYRIYMAAQLTGKSINAWMNEVLAEAAQRTIAASEESEEVLTPAGEAYSMHSLPFVLKEEPFPSHLSSTKTGQEQKEKVPVPSWPNVMPVRFIVPETIGKLVAEETTHKVAQLETSVSGEKLHDLVADAVQTAFQGIKENAPVMPIFIQAPVSALGNSAANAPYIYDPTGQLPTPPASALLITPNAPYIYDPTDQSNPSVKQSGLGGSVKQTKGKIPGSSQKTT